MTVTLNQVRHGSVDAEIQYFDQNGSNRTEEVKRINSKTFGIEPGKQFAPKIRLKTNNGKSQKAYVCISYR
jgi:hypothetical protein